MSVIKKWSIGFLAASVLVALLVGCGRLYMQMSKYREESSRLDFQLAAHKSQIMNFNEKLNQAQSNLKKQTALKQKFEDEVEKLDSQVKQIIADYEMKLVARDKTIASLKGKISGGNTVVTVKSDVADEVEKGEISYEWSDKSKRFHLFDPNIFKQNDETFAYNQSFSIRGLVFSDETGNIQIKNIEIIEVVPVSNDDGTIKYVEVTDSSVTLIDSQFDYTNNLQTVEEWRWYDPVSLRLLASIDTQLYPGVGVEIFNIGRLLPYMNIGVAPKLSLNLSDPLNGSLQKSTLGVGIVYNLIPPLIDTNLGIGVSLNTPFDNLGKMILTLDATFYLTQDLFPL